ncbi:MAG: ankyrin repeat domain-containing protein [Acidobacteriota bacterium]
MIALFFAIALGQASGSMVVSGKATALRHAYVVEKNTLLKVIISAEPLDDPATADDFTGIAVQLDEKKKAEEVFFFHPKLPAGLSVRELSRFEPKTVSATKVAGRLILDDDGNSFTYDVAFEAPIVHVKEAIDPLGADASKADHAKWRLKQLNIDVDESELRSRILRDDADAVKLLLDAGIPVKTENAIRTAVEHGNAKIVQILIVAGGDVNNLDAYKQSLLMSATTRPEITKILLAAKADPNIVNEYKIGPLSAAAEQGQLEVVKMLLAAGAKVNQRDPYGGTALSVAVLRGYKDVVKTLIDAGADVQRDKKDLLELAKDKPEIKAMIEAAAKKK